MINFDFFIAVIVIKMFIVACLFSTETIEFNEVEVTTTVKVNLSSLSKVEISKLLLEHGQPCNSKDWVYDVISWNYVGFEGVVDVKDAQDADASAGDNAVHAVKVVLSLFLE